MNSQGGQEKVVFLELKPAVGKIEPREEGIGESRDGQRGQERQ